MLLHLGVMLLGAPVMAAPLAQYLRAPASFADAWRWYLLAAAFEALVVLGWHIPFLHDAAGFSAVVFAIEQISFLAAGVALWTCVFTARTAGARLAASVVAGLTFSHMTMFGVLLAIAPRPIYSPDLCVGWGRLDRLDDQHLGGALMAAGGLVYLFVAAWLFVGAIAAARNPSPADTHRAAGTGPAM